MYDLISTIGNVGGTLGLFSGFSFLVIFEIFHWAIITVKKAFCESSATVEPKNSNDITIATVAVQIKSLEDSMKKEIENMKKENTELRKMIDGKNESPTKTMTVINIE